MNHSYKILWTVCVLLVCMAMIGCRPDDVLSNREMRDVLYDLHRMDGALQTAGYNYGHNEEVSAYYQSVLDRHGITQAQFDSSLVWFTDNPQIFNKIYPNVIARLQADMDHETALRDERVELKRGEKGKHLKQLGEEETEETSTPQKTVDDWIKIYMFGIENPWKEWKNEEFDEKDIILFGQIKTDTLASAKENKINLLDTITLPPLQSTPILQDALQAARHAKQHIALPIE